MIYYKNAIIIIKKKTAHSIRWLEVQWLEIALHRSDTEYKHITSNTTVNKTNAFSK